MFIIDYLLLKRNNHSFVVVCWGTVRQSGDYSSSWSWCKKYKLCETQCDSCAWSSLSLFLAIHFHRNDVDWHDDPFFQAANQFLRRTDSRGKSYTRVMTLIRTEMKEVNCLDTGCACDQNESLVWHRKSHYSNLEIVMHQSIPAAPRVIQYVMNSFINMKGCFSNNINRNLIQWPKTLIHDFATLKTRN